MAKLEAAGCAPPGLSIARLLGYLREELAIVLGTSSSESALPPLASLFVAHALDVPLSLGQELSLLFVLLLTSKGAAGVTGSGFITLAAMLSATGSIPVAGLTLLLGIDRFMSEARALTNFVGNAVATIVVCRWENQLDLERAGSLLGLASRDRHPVPREPRFQPPGGSAGASAAGDVGKSMAP